MIVEVLQKAQKDMRVNAKLFEMTKKNLKSQIHKHEMDQCDVTQRGRSSSGVTLRKQWKPAEM